MTIKGERIINISNIENGTKQVKDDNKYRTATDAVPFTKSDSNGEKMHSLYTISDAINRINDIAVNLGIYLLIKYAPTVL